MRKLQIVFLLQILNCEVNCFSLTWVTQLINFGTEERAENCIRVKLHPKLRGANIERKQTLCFISCRHRPLYVHKTLT